YQGITRAQIPSVTLPDGAGTARLIAGELQGLRGPARSFTPLQVWDLHLNAGHTVTLPAPERHTTLALLMRGELTAGEPVQPGDLLVFSREGAGVQLGATTNATVLWLTGEPIDEPIVGHGPFVMNTVDEIHQAVADFQDGRMGAF